MASRLENTTVDWLLSQIDTKHKQCGFSDQSLDGYVAIRGPQVMERKESSTNFGCPASSCVCANLDAEKGLMRMVAVQILKIEFRCLAKVSSIGTTPSLWCITSEASPYYDMPASK